MATTKQTYRKTGKDYEEKLRRVIKRIGATKLLYDYGLRSAWVEFSYKGQGYRFDHSIEQAAFRGVKLTSGKDAFVQIVYSLEDLARMSSRGIYDLKQWMAGMLALPAPTRLPECYLVLGFAAPPSGETEIHAAFLKRAKELHPDAGGSDAQFAALQDTEREALRVFREGGGKKSP